MKLDKYVRSSPPKLERGPTIKDIMERLTEKIQVNVRRKDILTERNISESKKLSFNPKKTPDVRIQKWKLLADYRSSIQEIDRESTKSRPKKLYSTLNKQRTMNLMNS